MSHNTDDTTTLAFCQMMTAKDEQIRRLVLKMANMQQHQTTPVSYTHLTLPTILLV